MSLSEPSIALKDSRKGWVIVCTLFLMMGIVIAGRNSIGLMMPFWKDDLGWSYGFVATAGAVMMTMMAAVAPAAGLVLDRFGARAIYSREQAKIKRPSARQLTVRCARRKSWCAQRRPQARQQGVPAQA